MKLISGRVEPIITGIEYPLGNPGIPNSRLYSLPFYIAKAGLFEKSSLEDMELEFELDFPLTGAMDS